MFEGNSNFLMMAIYFGFFLAIFYFFLVLPRKKQERKHTEMVASLKRGEKVVTIGGVHGEVTRLKDDSIILKVSENTEIEFLKKAIAYKVEG